MIVEIKVPPVGESITEGVIANWMKRDGAYVEEEEEIFELETDKITMAVPSTATGKLSIKVKVGTTVAIDQVVAEIDTEAVPDQIENIETDDKTITTPPLSTQTVPQTKGAEISAPAGMPQLHAKLSGSVDPIALSPAVRRMVEDHKINPSLIPPTGKGGRLIKEDVLRYLEQKDKPQPPVEHVAHPVSIPMQLKQVERKVNIPDQDSRQTRKPMTTLRARIAERLVIAQQTAAILTTFNEADMTELMAIRTRFKPVFEKKHGIKLGIMSFFVKAVVDALKTVPAVNAQIDGDEIVYNHFYDIGIAVSTERGLVVPVIRDADKLSFAEIEMQIADFGRRARDKSLTLNDLTGGVFTVSNGGVFGSMLSTPILNPPQSAILGLHGIKKRPMVVEDDRIEVRPMMYLAVSYDHRLIDGREAVTFLNRIIDCIENPERMLLEV